MGTDLCHVRELHRLARMNAIRCSLMMVAALLTVGCTNPELVYKVPPAKDGTVLVLGCVKTQGQQPWHRGLTARRVVELAGGFDLFANQKRVRIISRNIERSEGEPMTARRVDLREKRSDYPLQDGDVVIVEEKKMLPF